MRISADKNSPDYTELAPTVEVKVEGVPDDVWFLTADDEKNEVEVILRGIKGKVIRNESGEMLTAWMRGRNVTTTLGKFTAEEIAFNQQYFRDHPEEKQ